MNINKELKEYVEKEILPIYAQNDFRHGMEHINNVIKRSLKFAQEMEDINIDMVYTIAAFHDIAYHIDAKNHEILSAKIFFEDEIMEKIFTNDERKIIKEAIEEHTKAPENKKRSIYGEIIAFADRIVDLNNFLRSSYLYNKEKYPNLTDDEIMKLSYEYMKMKYEFDAEHTKENLIDEDFEKFKKDINKLINDKELYIRVYKDINNI